MTRCGVMASALLWAAVDSSAAQPAPAWRVTGDTSGAPPGCSARAAIATIDAWFRAFNAADSAALVRAMAPVPKHQWVVSTGRFAPSEDFVRIESIPLLVHYMRTRARQHERLTLGGVRFYGWSRSERSQLGFMPYYTRSADDLGPTPLPGIGKASYLCREGILILNFAPRPASLPGLP